jgi:large subunit ribosomal protein L23
MVLSVTSQRALAALRCRASRATPLAPALRTLSCGRAARSAAPVAASPSASHSVAPGIAPLEPGLSHAAPGSAYLAARQRQADCLMRWNWLESPEQRQALAVPFARRADCPAWLEEEYETARSYRSARARLWLPSSSAAEDATAAEQTEYVGRLKDTFRRVAERHPAMDGVAFDEHDAWRAPGLQQTLDEELMQHWRELSGEERQASILRLRFECIRRLGWRAGYTAGYPLRPYSSAAVREARKVLVSKTGTTEKSATAREEAREQLAQEDEAAAWRAWQGLSIDARLEEERAAWSQRDRSRLWIDDSSTSLVLGESAPRWFAHAPRVGIPTLLPTETVRLVRNFVPKGGKADPWKASFRLPLDMSKHALVNYLRSIYGLHVTWVRTQVYRSQISRSRVGRGKTAKGQRTWKKAEVGLLEPFVFPELTQQFRRESLMQEVSRVCTPSAHMS